MGAWAFVDWNVEKTLEKLDVRNASAPVMSAVPLPLRRQPARWRFINKELAAFLEAAFEKQAVGATSAPPQGRAEA